MSKAFYRFDNEKRRRGEYHPNQRQLTPPYILHPIAELLGGIDLDPCTEPDNPTGATRFYTPPQDGASLPWDARNVYCNPPYGEARNRWVDRCIEEGRNRPVALLIPAHTETATFQRALANCTSVLFINSRVRFGLVRDNGRQEAASHGSALFGFGLDLTGITIPGIVMKRSEQPVDETERLGSEGQPQRIYREWAADRSKIEGAKDWPDWLKGRVAILGYAEQGFRICEQPSGRTLGSGAWGDLIVEYADGSLGVRRALSATPAQEGER